MMLTLLSVALLALQDGSQADDLAGELADELATDLEQELAEELADGLGDAINEDEPAPYGVLDRVEVVVNERVTTTLELQSSIGSVSTSKEYFEGMMRARIARANSLLEDQAGRDLGFDAANVKRTVRRIEESDIEQAGGITVASEELADQGVDQVKRREQISELLYGRLWTDYHRGLAAGPGGRISRDRYVRPAVLHMAYREDPTQFGISAAVTLQQLILTYGPNPTLAQVEATERHADGMRDALLNGADMDKMVEDYGSTRKGTKGYATLPEHDLRLSYPELIPFLEGARPGDISEAMPYTSTVGDGPIGIMILRFIEREAAKDFSAFQIQTQVLTELQDLRDDERLARGRFELMQSAYVWTPEREAQPESENLIGPPRPPRAGPRRQP